MKKIILIYCKHCIMRDEKGRLLIALSWDGKTPEHCAVQKWCDKSGVSKNTVMYEVINLVDV